MYISSNFSYPPLSYISSSPWMDHWIFFIILPPWVGVGAHLCTTQSGGLFTTDFRRSSQLKFLLKELLYLTRFRCASCYLLWRHELKYPVNQPFFWNIWKGCRATPRVTTTLTGIPRARGRTSSVRNCSWGSRMGRSMLARTAPALGRRPYRRRSIIASLIARSIIASLIAIYELRVTMQGQHSSGSPLLLASETNSSHSTIFNSATKRTPRVWKNTFTTYMLRT